MRSSKPPPHNKPRRPTGILPAKSGSFPSRAESTEHAIYGVGPVRELIARHPERIRRLLVDAKRGQDAPGDVLVRLLTEAKRLGLHVDPVPREALEQYSGPDSPHQGVVAILTPFVYAELEDVLAVPSTQPPLWVALDGVTDPRNLGAIIRTAYVAGAAAVLIPGHRAAGVTPLVAKVSAGASELIPIVMATNLGRGLEALKAAGLWISGVHASATSQPIQQLDYTGASCLVMGAEGAGLRPSTAALCDFHAQIPMIGQGVGSYNVSVAAGMALYEVMRQRFVP